MPTDANRYHFLGIDVQPLTIDDLNAIVDESVRADEQRIIANHNLHSVYLYHRVPEMRRFYCRASVAHVDGMSLVYLAQLLGLPFDARHRVTYVDWVGPLLQMANENAWRVFYVGSKPGTLKVGAECIRQTHPDVELATHHGYFDADPDSAENRRVVEAVNAFAPHVLMVGMGMPRQEKWIVDNLDQLRANAILQAGACIDYVAGDAPTPPRWMGPLGLEWLYRFFQEPRRLWYRHFIEPIPVLIRFVRELVRTRLLSS